MRRALFLAALCAFAPVSTTGFAADAPLRWDIETDRNSFTLTLRHKDPKAPLPFLAACEAVGDLKLTIGAPLDLVKKPGGSVAVTLKAGGKSASVSGKAVFNQFTKAMELVVETNASHPLFSVLATGKPVQVGGPAKTPVTWPAADGDAVRLWVSDCTYRVEH